MVMVHISQLRDIVERQPLTVKFAGTVFSLDSHLSHFFFSFFLKFFLCMGLLGRFTLIHRLEFPLSKPKKLGTFGCGKMYYLTMRNDVAHLTVIKTEAACCCKEKRLGTQGLVYDFFFMIQIDRI